MISMEKVSKGDLVILLKMDDIQSPPKRTQGIVQHIDDAGQIHIKWENGSSLALIPGEDKFDVIKVKYKISNNHLIIYKDDFLSGEIHLKKVIDIYNAPNSEFFTLLWTLAKKHHITPEQFYKADFHYYNNTDKTLELLLPEVIKSIEKPINRWFAYPDSKHIEWLYYNLEQHEYYRMTFNYEALQTEIALCENPKSLFNILSWAVISKNTVIFRDSNLINGYNAIHGDNCYAITEISEENTEDTYNTLVEHLVLHGYRYFVSLTNDAFDYNFIIYDILKKEYAEKENGEYYLFNDKTAASKCCRELNRTGVK